MKRITHVRTGNMVSSFPVSIIIGKLKRMYTEQGRDSELVDKIPDVELAELARKHLTQKEISDQDWRFRSVQDYQCWTDGIPPPYATDEIAWRESPFIVQEYSNYR